MNFLTVSGVAATRRSPAACSFNTAIFTGGPQKGSGDQDDDEHCRDRRRNCSPFDESDETRIGLLMRFNFMLRRHVLPSVLGHLKKYESSLRWSVKREQAPICNKICEN